MKYDVRPPLADVQVTVDVVVFVLQNDTLKALLIRRSQEPFRYKLALPGGFLWEDETTAETAARVLRDKAGVSEVLVEQLYTFDEVQRDPRGRIMAVTYYALVPFENLQIVADEDTEDPKLYDVAKLEDLAFDHAKILAYALTRLRSKLAYSNAAYSLLPEHFRLSELQRVYEVVMGHALDKRNFRKKYLSLGFIEATTETSSGERHRPAVLYRFVRRSLQELPDGVF